MDRLIEKIVDDLNTSVVGREIKYYSVLESTNERAKQLAKEGYNEGTVVIADEQTGGKGRLGRRWFSPPGSGLWLSIILYPELEADRVPLMTIIASLAVYDVIESLGLITEIKWPNDILIKGHKVCGILSEMSVGSTGINYVITGIGLNVNQTYFPEEIREFATSLRIELGKELNRAYLLQIILEAFERYYFMLTRGKIDLLINLWKERMKIINKRIQIKNGQEIASGIVIDISNGGELILRDDTGNIHLYWAGDTSLVK